jgi:hypothetical protein
MQDQIFDHKLDHKLKFKDPEMHVSDKSCE